MIFLGIILFISCLEITPEQVEKEVLRQYEERRATIISDKMSQCQRQLFKDAQTFADSILRIESKQSKMDSIKVPHDTLRPQKPDIKFPDYKKPARDSVLLRSN